jgi:hypothetical protein
MIKITDLTTYNFKNAIIGMRHPLESYGKIDSLFDGNGNIISLGQNDLKLMKTLTKAGSDHRKFMRQIFISFNVTAPLYWFKEFDTYKISTVANSTSTMHTAHKKGITTDMFSFEGLEDEDFEIVDKYLDLIEKKRLQKDRKSWKAMIQLLPSSLNQTRMITMNYEVFLNMYNSRKNHKLSEWIEFCEYLYEKLPYFKRIAELS